MTGWLLLVALALAFVAGIGAGAGIMAAVAIREIQRFHDRILQTYQRRDHERDRDHRP